MKLPAARADVLAAMASGRLATADREDLAAVLENLTQEMLPVTMKINPVTRSKRVVGKLLDWLEEQPGDSWQERWELWTARGEPDWRPHPGSSGKGVRQETAYAINALIMVDAVRPSYDWMLSARLIWGQVAPVIDVSHGVDGAGSRTWCTCYPSCRARRR